MAVRGSFKKRQKEGERREKRQLKLDRRQGKVPARVSVHSDEPANENGPENQQPAAEGLENKEATAEQA